METQKNRLYNYFMVGFATATIIWCFSFSYIIGQITKVHEQEIKCLIENSNNEK